MCAIFGTPSESMLEVLYEANKERGSFASSCVQLTYDDQYIFKKEGEIDFDDINSLKASMEGVKILLKYLHATL